MVIVPVDAFFFIGLTTAPAVVEGEVEVVLTTVLGLEERCCNFIGLPILPMAEEEDVVVVTLLEGCFLLLAMMRGCFFFFFLGLMPIITLPLGPDIILTMWCVVWVSINS